MFNGLVLPYFWGHWNQRPPEILSPKGTLNSGFGISYFSPEQRLFSAAVKREYSTRLPRYKKLCIIYHDWWRSSNLWLTLYPLYFPLLWFWLCRNSWALRPFRWGLFSANGAGCCVGHCGIGMRVLRADAYWKNNGRNKRTCDNLWFCLISNHSCSRFWIMCNVHIVASKTEQCGNVCVFSYLGIWWTQ